MKHPLLTLADRERLNSDPLERALYPAKVANVRAKAKSYKLADGGGLFLLVLPKGNGRKPSCLWRYKYRINGREGLYAIGPLSEIGLADARQIHRSARWLVQRGIHPAHYVWEELERQDTELRRKQANTLRAISEQWVARDAKRLAPTSLAQRRRELDNDVLPTLGDKPIGEIRKEELSALLERIQKRAPEVARNVRQHLSGVFGYAMDAGLVTGSPVPGSKVLQARKQTAHPALSLDKVHRFLTDLDAASCNAQTKIAARLLMLTAVRKSELVGATWSEFDLDKAEWRIPAERMKMRESHWVALPPQAVQLLRELRLISTGDLLFPNVRDRRRPMAGGSLNALLKRLGYLEEAKPHGFRAMFSTYLNEAGWNPDVVEKCLAHKHKDAIRAKYNRAEYRDDQRRLMQHWADTLDAMTAGGSVVPFRKGAA